MRKYIGVSLCFFLIALALVPDTYSLWRRDLGVIGHVQITVEQERGIDGELGDKPGDGEALQEKVGDEVEDKNGV